MLQIGSLVVYIRQCKSLFKLVEYVLQPYWSHCITISFVQNYIFTTNEYFLWSENSDHTKEFVYIYIRFLLERFTKLGDKYINVSFFGKISHHGDKKKGSCDSLKDFLRIKMAPSLSYFDEKMFEFFIFKL